MTEAKQKIAPPGAITTVEELQAVIDKANSSRKPVDLFVGYDLGYVREETVFSGSTISPEPQLGLFLSSRSHGVFYSLGDRNIPPNRYNNHWWFANESDAQAYVKSGACVNPRGYPAMTKGVTGRDYR